MGNKRISYCHLRCPDNSVRADDSLSLQETGISPQALNVKMSR